MAKLNFKTVSSEIKESLAKVATINLKLKEVRKEYATRLADLKEERKSYYEDNDLATACGLHDNKIAIEEERKLATDELTKELATLKASLVNESFYKEYSLVTSLETITPAQDTRWKNALATFLASIGVGGADNERNIDKFNPYRWTGKGKGEKAFQTVVTNDLTNILIDKGIIVFDETTNEYKVA